MTARGDEPSLQAARPGGAPTGACVLGAAGTVGLLSGSGLQELSVDGFESRTICVQLRRTRCALWMNGRLVRDGWMPPGAWQSHSPGESFRGVGHGYELVRYSITEPALGGVLAGLEMDVRPSSVEIRESPGAPGPFLLALSLEIRGVLARADPPSRLYADTLFQNLIAHLVTRHSNLAGGPAGGVAQGGLTPWQARRVTEYMMSGLDGDITLAELAAVALLSPFHFCRAFKRSFGVPPFQWQAQKRIERAQVLMADPGRSLLDVALSVGYASQGAFGAAFRRATGMTPAAWRRANLNR